MPNLYIIAGCNGAGKTTASYTILPEILNCKEFVNADNMVNNVGQNPVIVATGGTDFEKVILNSDIWHTILRQYHDN